MSLTRHHLRRINESGNDGHCNQQGRNSSSKEGFWSFLGLSGGNKYQRRGPQPVFGTKKYSYNYDGFVVGTQLTESTGLRSYSIFVKDGQQVSSLSPNAKIRPFSISIPANVYPLDKFRVLLDGLEVLVKCPDVSGPGESVTIFVEYDDTSAFVWKVTDSSAESCNDHGWVVGTVAVYADADEILFAKKAYYSV